MIIGNKIIIVTGSRLRRISDDGKKLLDENMNEGAIIDYDMPAQVEQIIHSKDKSKTAYIVKLQYEGRELSGWCYQYEITAGS